MVIDTNELTRRLSAAAVRYCSDGWPIVPTCPEQPERLVCGLTPADADTARQWWTDRAHGVACRTGLVFDVLEVPSWLGQRVLPAIEHYTSVIEVEQPLERTWQFLVTPRSPTIQELRSVATARLHTAGGWIPLPPTPIPGGSIRWVCRSMGEQLPHSLCLQWAVVRALLAARRTRGTEASSG